MNYLDMSIFFPEMLIAIRAGNRLNLIRLYTLLLWQTNIKNDMPDLETVS